MQKPVSNEYSDESSSSNQIEFKQRKNVDKNYFKYGGSMQDS